MKSYAKRKFNLMAMVATLLCQAAMPLQAESDFSQNTIGKVTSKLPGLWLGEDFILFDGKISYPQQDSEYNDRRVISETFLGFKSQFSASLSALFHLNGSVTLAKEADSEGGGAETNYQTKVFEALAAVGYVTPTKVNLMAGFLVDYETPYTISREVNTVSSHINYDESLLRSAVFGFYKNSSQWSFSVYYVHGATATRKYHIESSQDENVVDDVIEDYIPQRYGILFKTIFGSYVLGSEIQAIAGGSGGPKTTDGISINEDYNRYDLMFTSNWSGSSSHVNLIYRSLKYSDNAFMSLDNIPMYNIRLSQKFGSADQFFEIGMLCGYGQDKQSLDEFNAEYSVLAPGAFMEMQWGF